MASQRRPDAPRDLGADPGADPVPTRPTDPPPPTYPMLRDSTALAAAEAISLDDDEGDRAISVDEQAPKHDDSAIDERVVERVLTPREMEWLALGPDQSAFVAAIDGTRSVATVGVVAGLDASRARAVLEVLVRRGVVRCRP